jgi:hypothetical protein
MRHLSAAEVVCPSERIGQPIAADDPTRLSRRQFLCRSTLTLAGIGAVSGLPWLQRRALAQGVQPGTGFTLLGRSTGRAVPGSPSLFQLFHSYRYDYRFGLGNRPSIPPVITSRQGQPLTTMLQPLSTQAPPYPSPPPPNQPQLLICNRLAQLRDQETVTVFDWCSFYGSLGDEIVITAGNDRLSYVVPTLSTVPIEIGIPNFWPSVNPGGWEGRSNQTDGFYWLTYSSQRVVSSTAMWTTTLTNVSSDRPLKVDAYIPGSSQPERRTANARYEIVHAGGVAIATADQRVATGTFIPLVDPRYPDGYPFYTGTFQIRLTDVTGEPTGERAIVAIGIRYRSL